MFGSEDRERQKIRRNTLSNTPSKNTRSYNPEGVKILRKTWICGILLQN